MSSLSQEEKRQQHGKHQQQQQQQQRKLPKLTFDVTAITPSLLPFHYLWNSRPCFTIDKAHGEEEEVADLVALKDGSFLSRSVNCVKRWKRTLNQGGFEAVGTYEDNRIRSVIEIDNDRIATGAQQRIKVWNKTTCECIRTVHTGAEIVSLLKLRKGSHLFCWSVNERDMFTVEAPEVFRLSNFSRNRSIKLNRVMCELEDGTFITSSAQLQLQRWDMAEDLSQGTLLQTYKTDGGDVLEVIELKRDIIVGLTQRLVIIWRVSSGEVLFTLPPRGVSYGWNTWKDWRLQKVKEGFFAVGRKSRDISLWDERGNNIATYRTEHPVGTMARLADGSLVTGDYCQIQIRTP